ncbi:MAG: protein translocase subunit SecD [Actinomycetota bacterium]
MNKRRYKVHLIVALLVAFGGLGAVVATDSSPRLGLDLEGGTSVILTATSAEQLTDEVLNRTVSIIRQRIDALGVAEPEVTRSGENILIQLPGVDDSQQALEVIGTTAQLTFRQVKRVVQPGAKNAPEPTELKDSSVNDQEVIYPSADSSESDILYVLEPARLTGEAISRAEAIPPSAQTGTTGWSVSLEFTDSASDQWADFTSDLACLRDEGEQIKSQVAIVLDGEVQSAAGMQDPSAGGGGVSCGEGIRGGDTQITVADEREARDLALVLKTGALPITLEQSEVNKVSPTLGRDSLNAGLTAGMIGLGLVLLYVLIYYRALGLVVWAGLAVFSASFYSLLAFLGETSGLALSLAGIAGAIVSIGITTDSYIVAFERLKDEIRSGKSMRASVDRGMQRAFKTILVADFVTGSAAVILFFLAVGPVRGFALTLGLATMIDILIAYFFTRPMVVLLSRTRFFTEKRFIGIRDALGVQSS